MPKDAHYTREIIREASSYVIDVVTEALVEHFGLTPKDKAQYVAQLEQMAQQQGLVATVQRYTQEGWTADEIAQALAAVSERGQRRGNLPTA